MIVPTVKKCQNDRACSKEKYFDSLNILLLNLYQNFWRAQISPTVKLRSRFHFAWPASGFRFPVSGFRIPAFSAALKLLC